MSVSRDELVRFVDGALLVRLATVSKKGTPLLTPLWFARDGDVIYAGTREGSLQARHINETPRVVMLFGDVRGRPLSQWLRVSGTARVRDIRQMSGLRKARLAWRYFLRPKAVLHFVSNWRKLSVRKRYYAERTDPAMVEITLEQGELVSPDRG